MNSTQGRRIMAMIERLIVACVDNNAPAPLRTKIEEAKKETQAAIDRADCSHLDTYTTMSRSMHGRFDTVCRKCGSTISRAEG